MSPSTSSALSPLLNELLQQLKILPGIGPKSAQRLAFDLLKTQQRDAAKQLANTLLSALNDIHHCPQCRTYTEQQLCPICANDQRQSNQLCVVQSPLDIIAIEQSGAYQGKYFVLMGNLSPIDGIGPKEIGLDQLAQRLQSESIDELILATSATVEGEATAFYCQNLAKQHQCLTTRLAVGIPMGGELEYLNKETLSQALHSRTQM